MNKNELISKVADSAKMTKTEATRAVDSVLDIIAKSMKKGEDVRLTGFGTFTVTRRKATMGRNPRTGESIKIPASNMPRFRPGKGLRDTVN